MPNEIEKVSGNKQRAHPGEVLPKPVVVRVIDEGGNPVPDVPVRFKPDPPEGEADPPETHTDAEGKAQTSWRLSEDLGRQKLKARSPETENRTVFKAFAKETVGNEIEKVSGNWQEGPVGRPLPEPLVVLVTDPGYDPVPGAPVSFQPQCGAAAPPETTTGQDGTARTEWTPGTEVLGLVKTKASSPEAVNKVRFKAECWDPAQPRIRKVSGDWQTGAPGEVLPLKLEVEVLDEGGNPIPDVPVEFLPEEGQVDPPQANTGPDGRAGTAMTLGPDPGRQKVKAASPSTPNSTTFLERAK